MPVAQPYVYSSLRYVLSMIDGLMVILQREAKLDEIFTMNLPDPHWQIGFDSVQCHMSSLRQKEDP